MNKETIKNIIKDGGATLTSELKKANTYKGYMVSLYGSEKVLTLNNIDNIIFEISETASNIQPGQYLGLWIDKELLYIDITINIPSKQEAINTGLLNKQQAIFDVQRGKSIYLDKYAFIIYRYNSIKDDYNYIAEVATIEQVMNLLGSNYKRTINNIHTSIDNIDTSRLINGTYQVIREAIR